MCGHQKGCGHWGKDKRTGGDWDKDYDEMSPEEKKEMLEKKQKFLKEKMAWVEEELKKLKG